MEYGTPDSGEPRLIVLFVISFTYANVEINGYEHFTNTNTGHPDCPVGGNVLVRIQLRAKYC